MGSHKAIDIDRPSLTYRGHRITTLRDTDGWRGIMNDNVLTAVTFDSAEEASAWVRRRIDDKIAEAIFPGLAQSAGTN